MNEYKKGLDVNEKQIADQVADEILTVEDDDKKRFLILLLLFLLCLIFLVASLSFAIFNNYYNGGHTNVIDVGTDIVIDRNEKPINGGDSSGKKSNSVTPIDSGSVFFSFNEKSNYIDMYNVLPTSDDVGKKLSGDKEFFDFNISATLKNKSAGKLVYEISLIPVSGNTINPDDIRVYLTENGKEVSINKNVINNFSDLPDSKYRSDAKVIYKKTISISKTYTNDYVFRMWYSYKADVPKESKKFGCKVAVDAYYE